MKKEILCLFICLEVSVASATIFTTFDENLSGFNASISGQSTTTLDFESLSNGESLTSQFTASNGVTFSDGLGDLTVLGDLFGSNPIGLLGVQVTYTASAVSNFTSVFSEGVNSVGGYFMDNSSPISVDLFDSSNNLLSSFSISATTESGNSAEWWGVTSDESIIAKATFSATILIDGIGFDGFTFSKVNTVPEPSVVLLFGSGLVGLIRMRKTSGKFSGNYA